MMVSDVRLFQNLFSFKQNSKKKTCVDMLKSSTSGRIPSTWIKYANQYVNNLGLIYTSSFITVSAAVPFRMVRDLTYICNSMVYNHF